jgi:hypothetical protein
MYLCDLKTGDVLVQGNHGGFWVVMDPVPNSYAIHVYNRKTGDTRSLRGEFVPDVYVEVMRGNRTIWRRSGGGR